MMINEFHVASGTELDLLSRRHVFLQANKWRLANVNVISLLLF